MSPPFRPCLQNRECCEASQEELSANASAAASRGNVMEQKNVNQELWSSAAVNSTLTNKEWQIANSLFRPTIFSRPLRRTRASVSYDSQQSGKHLEERHALCNSFPSVSTNPANKFNSIQPTLFSDADQILTTLERIQKSPLFKSTASGKGQGLQSTAESLADLPQLIQKGQFQRLLAIHNTIQAVQCFQCPPRALCSNSQDLITEVYWEKT